MKKNNFFTRISTTVMLSILAFLVISPGCKTATPLKDALGQTLSTADIQTYGRTIGNAGYYVYSFYKNNPQYSTEIARMEQIWSAIETAKANGGREGLDLAAVNDATVKLITMAATAEWGPANGALVGEGARLALLLGYNFYKSRLKEDNLEVYLAAVWEGVQDAKANGADLIAQPTDIDELIAMEPSEACGLDCIIDKIRSRLDAGGLTNYDKKRLEARLDKLQKEMDAIEAEVKAAR